MTTITDEQRAPLRKAMEARIEELDITWRDVAAAAGISYETVRKARTGPGGIPSRTRRALERGLRWARGSVDAVLAGDKPAPLSPADLVPTVAPSPDLRFTPAGYLAAILDELAEEWGEEVLQDAWRLRETKRDLTEQP